MQHRASARRDPKHLTGVIAHEQLDAVKVQELGDVEAENAFAPEHVASEFHRQFLLPYFGRPLERGQLHLFSPPKYHRSPT